MQNLAIVIAEYSDGTRQQLYFGNDAEEANRIREANVLTDGIELLLVYINPPHRSVTSPNANVANREVERTAGTRKLREEADKAKATADKAADSARAAQAKALAAQETATLAEYAAEHPEQYAAELAEKAAREAQRVADELAAQAAALAPKAEAPAEEAPAEDTGKKAKK